jgi:hypothetical protein
MIVFGNLFRNKVTKLDLKIVKVLEQEILLQVNF